MDIFGHLSAEDRAKYLEILTKVRQHLKKMGIANYIIFLLCLCVLRPGFCVEETIVLTLDEAITIALRENRDILLDEEN